jgi:hypothetical protein
MPCNSRRLARRLVDWNNNYGGDDDKCVLFHCGNWAKSFLPDIKIANAPILGSTLGVENTYGALDGRTPAGPLTYGRITTDDNRGVIRAYVGEGELTNDELKTFGNRAVAHVPKLQKLLRHVCRQGFEHHVVMTPRTPPPCSRKRSGTISAGRSIITRNRRNEPMTDRELELKSWQYRREVLRWIKHAGAGHTGGSLSCVDILNVLYHRILNVFAGLAGSERDRYVQSKGHSVEALYVVLADRGFFPASELETLCRYHRPFVGHPTRKSPASSTTPGRSAMAFHSASVSPWRGNWTRHRSVSSPAGRRRAGGRLELGGGDGGGALPARQPHGHRRPQHPADHRPHPRRMRQRTARCAKFAAFGWAVRTVDGHDLAG